MRVQAVALVSFLALAGGLATLGGAGAASQDAPQARDKPGAELQKQLEKRHRALAQHDRFGAAKQDFGVRIQPERTEFIRRRHG